MNVIYRVVAILGLAACYGQAWAAGQHGTNCNSSLTATEITPLQFGAFDATVGGTVTVDATTPTPTITASGVTMVGTPQAGVIQLSLDPTFKGNCNLPLTITLPTSYTLTNTITGQKMVVDTLTTSIANGTTVTITAAAPLMIYVGGRLTVTPGQVGGNYQGSYSFDASF